MLFQFTATLNLNILKMETVHYSEKIKQRIKYYKFVCNKSK